MKFARAIALALLTVLIACSAFAQDLPRKKLIQTGWDHVTPERLLQQIEDVEKTPFQGLVVRFVGRGNTPAFHVAFQNADWDMEAIEDVIADLNAAEAASTRPMERFLLMNANPGSVDWFDDEGWASIIEHWRIAARVAREGGLTGILFDPEPYNKPFRQFAWLSQSQREQHTFAEYHVKARERGAAVMQAIASEYPEMTLLCYFMNSVNAMAAGRPDPVSALAGDSSYDLYPGFIDGWLDVAPPTLTFVDGCEGAYLFNSQVEYLAAYNRIKSDCQWLVSPENRAKYRAQVQAGLGMYLDPYINPPDNHYYIDPMGMDRAARLGQNVGYALATADEYVWVYGEKASWWETPHSRANEQRWWDALPGISEQLRAAADPISYALQIMAERGAELANLAVNGGFQSATVGEAAAPPEADWDPNAAPPNWSFWQNEWSTGTSIWDRETGHDAPGSTRMAGVMSGCTLQKIPVTPGGRYCVVAWRKHQGQGGSSIRVRWQDPDAKWYQPSLDVMIDAAGPRDEWVQMAGVVTVPEGVGYIVPLLGANGQLSPDDVVWYDDVAVFEMD